MDNIYHEAVQAVERGARFSVDFPTRTLKVDGKQIIQNGKYEGSLGVEPCTEAEFLSRVEELYHAYKHSIPSERSESQPRRYFRALPERELSDEAMLYGGRRDRAQIKLELYLLCQILSGLKWNPDTMARWFWQSRQDKDLVILRQWVEPGYNNQSFNH